MSIPRAVVVFFVITVARASSAQEEPAGLTSAAAPNLRSQGIVDPSNGAFVRTVPIEVPPFRGITPKLVLAYNSAAQNGQVGVGWQLAGFSQIVAAGPNKGAQQPDKPLTFLLDGEELIACSDQSFVDGLGNPMSPSCQSARVAGFGYHDFYSTKTETSLRIRRLANTWAVASMDGSVRTYEEQVTGRVWGLRYVDDTQGNRVTYNWWCDGHKCYPDTITYTRALVRFYWESRPDALSFGDGSGVWTTAYRLKTIQVLVGSPAAQTTRVYALSYTPTQYTSRSLLTGLDVFGSDAVVDPNTGAVTNAPGASRMPHLTLGYADESRPTFAAQVPTHHAQLGTWGRHAAVDFDGDGRTDLVWNDLYSAGSPNSWTIQAWRNAGDGSMQYYGLMGTPAWDNVQKPAFAPLDINGDGKTDLCLSDVRVGQWKLICALSNGNGSWRFTTPQTLMQRSSWNQRDIAHPIVADLDGDSDPDLCIDYLSYDNGVNWGHTLYCAGNAGGIFASLGAGMSMGGFTWGDLDTSYQLLDLTGDRIADVCYEFPNDNFGPPGAWQLVCARGRGDGQADAGVIHTFTSPAFSSFRDAQVVVGDFNGDGLSDLCRSQTLASGWTVGCALADGWGVKRGLDHLSFFSPSLVVSSPFVSDTADYNTVLPGDFNGDGNTDLCAILTGNGWRSTCALSDGRGRFQPGYRNTHATSGRWAPVSAKFAADFDGDGLTDLAAVEYVVKYAYETFDAHVALTAGRPVLLRSQGNGIGGTTTITYSPSSVWLNKNNPPITQTVTSIEVNDGRGGVASTLYEYSGGEFSHAERRFLGFMFLFEYPPLIPGEGWRPRNVTRFSQDLPSLGRPLETWLQRRVSFSFPYVNQAYALYRYHTSWVTDLPYTARLVSRADYLYDNAENYQVTRKSYTYDDLYPASNGGWTWGTGDLWKAGYGVPYVTTDEGNAALAGDEEKTLVLFSKNNVDFLVRPYYIQHESGSTILSATSFYYDLPLSTDPLPPLGQPPVDGLVTHRLDWLDTAAVYATFVPTQRFAYDAFGNVILSRDARGYNTTYTIDTTYNLFVVATTNALGHTLSTPLADWVLRCNAPGRAVDPNHVVTETMFDGLCRTQKTRICDALGAEKYRESFNYRDDLRGLPGAQHAASFTPSADGVSNQFAQEYYDGLGRVFRTDAKGPGPWIRKDRVYDARGNLWKSYAPYYTDVPPPTAAEYRYDTLGRRIRTTLPDGRVETQSYGLEHRSGDPAGVFRWLRTDRVDAGLHASAQRINARGRLDQRGEDAGAALAWTEYFYAPGGTLRFTVDPALNTTEYTHDSLGRQTRHIDPDRGIWDFEYDDASNLTRTLQAVVLPSGQRQSVRFEYDALSRATRKTVLDASGERATHFLYDQVRPGSYNLGKLTTVRDNCSLGTCVHSPFLTGAALSSLCNPMANRVCEWDAYCCSTAWDSICVAEAKNWYGECTSDSYSERSTVYLDYAATGQIARRHQSVDDKSFLFQYTYDQGGRLISTVLPEGDMIGPTTYDGAGRVKTIPGFVNELRYDAGGQVTWQSNANGTDTTYSYDPARLWPTRIFTRGPGDPQLQDLGLAGRDAEGKLLAVASPKPLEGWSSVTYSNQHQMTSAVNVTSATYNHSLSYDRIGNVTYNSYFPTTPICAAAGENYCYDTTPYKPHAASRSGSTSYAYDANGNTTTLSPWTLSYNGENLLAWAAEADGLSRRLVRFGYDVFGLRSKRVTNGACVLYVGDEYEYDVTTGDATRYVSLGGRLLAKTVRRGGGTTEKYWIHTDHLGSVNVVTRESDGVEVGRWKYRPYGVLLEKTGTHVESRTFTAQRQDLTGLLYLHARYYDPRAARFISPDSVIPTQALVGLNRYAYAGNDPANYVDPSGNFLIEAIIVGAVIGALSAGYETGWNGEAMAMGAFLGMVSGAVGYGAGAAMFGLTGGTGLVSMVAGGMAGGAAGGGVSAGLAAYFTGGNVMDAAMAGAAYGALAGGVTAGLTDIRIGEAGIPIPGAATAAAGAATAGYMQCGWECAGKGAAWAAAGQVLNNLIIRTELTAPTKLPNAGSAAHKAAKKGNEIYVTGPVSEDVDDFRTHLLGSLDRGYSHTEHSMDSGSYYKYAGRNGALVAGGVPYVQETQPFATVTANCTTPYGATTPGQLFARYNYAGQGAYWWWR